MNLSSLAVLVVGLFGVMFTASVVMQSIVSWAVVGVMAFYIGMQFVKSRSSETNFTIDSTNRTSIIVEACAIGCAFMIGVNFIFSSFVS